MEPRVSRYAIPLATLVAGAQVAVSEQVEVQAEVAAPPWPTGGLVPAWGDGGGSDADGE